MKKYISVFVVCISSVVTLCGCLSNQQLKPEDWLGRYTYREPAVEGNITSWEILVNRLNGNFFSILNASNPQGNFSYSCEVATAGNNLFVIYDKSLSKPDAGYEKGDTLIMLRKNNNEIATIWKKMRPPALPANMNPCKCFTFRGRNENDNEISLP